MNALSLLMIGFGVGGITGVLIAAGIYVRQLRELESLRVSAYERGYAQGLKDAAAVRNHGGAGRVANA